MRPLTLEKHKSMLHIGGKPLLEHIVERFPKEIDELIVVVGYLSDQVKQHCGNEFLGRKVRYVHQEKPLGTYHALKLTEPFLEKDERFFMFFADDIHGAEGIKECLKHERALIVEETEEPWKFGIVKVEENNRVTDFVEKPKDPPSNLASTGVLLLDTKIFEYEANRHQSGEFYLTSAIAKMLKGGHKIFAVKSSLWIPIGYPEDLKKAEKQLEHRNDNRCRS